MHINEINLCLYQLDFISRILLIKCVRVQCYVKQTLFYFSKAVEIIYFFFQSEYTLSPNFK